MNNIENVITTLAQANPVVAGILSLWALGVCTFLMRNVPKAIGKVIRRNTTTSVEIASANTSFYKLMAWLEREGHSKRFRSLKIRNGRWGDDSDANTSVGAGYNWIWYKRRLLILYLEVKESSGTLYDKEVLTIICLGRKHDLINELIAESTHITDPRKMPIHILQNKQWVCVQETHKYDWSNIILQEDLRTEICRVLKHFLESEEWYKKHGIPYHLGIMLHGPSGTGKTTLIKTIASHINYGIALFSTTTIPFIEEAIHTLPNKTIMVIEDIDAADVTHSRKTTKPQKDSLEELDKAYGMFDISTVLNALDGITSAHGCIVIATTNHIDKLDKALIRPGRFDLTVHVDYIRREEFKKVLNKFFPGSSIDLNDYVFTDKELTVAKIQEDIMRGAGFTDIVKKYLDNSGNNVMTQILNDSINVKE